MAFVPPADVPSGVDTFRLTPKAHRRIREVYEDWNRGVREFLPGRQTDDLLIHSLLANEDFRGAEGFKRWVDEIDEQFEHWSLGIDQILDAPDGRVAVLGDIDVVGRASGVGFTQEMGWVYRFEGDLIAEMWIFAGHEEALSEAGLET